MERKSIRIYHFKFFLSAVVTVILLYQYWNLTTTKFYTKEDSLSYKNLDNTISKSLQNNQSLSERKEIVFMTREEETQSTVLIESTHQSVQLDESTQSKALTESKHQSVLSGESTQSTVLTESKHQSVQLDESMGSTVLTEYKPESVQFDESKSITVLTEFKHLPVQLDESTEITVLTESKHQPVQLDESTQSRVLKDSKHQPLQLDESMGSTVLTESKHQPVQLDESMGIYLVPITKGLNNMTSINDSFSEFILRSGLGLQPYQTETNDDIWIENGVQYRPFPFLEKNDTLYYCSEFEAYVPFNKTLFFEGDKKISLEEITEKKIILWWQHKYDYIPIDGLDPIRGCPDFPCVLTTNREYTENSSAMIVNAQFVVSQSLPKRQPNQVLIHYQIEPPKDYWFLRPNGEDLFAGSTEWNVAFNWTMSYRMDSDIATYYGIVRRRRVIKKKNYADILSKKNGLVACMVSRCGAHSRRDDYVKELQKYLPVDTYGGCGTLQCSRSSDKDCLNIINIKYKFFLSFENNFCKDYITEKLYRYLNNDMIVIARGYNTYSRLLPSEIFLNTANFKSPKELAEKILYLDAHDQEYIQMLAEKDKYFSIFEDYPLSTQYLEYRYEAVALCEVCKRLWNISNYTKNYSDMFSWMNNEEYQCQTPTDLD